MNNQISAETLSPITHKQIPVITTELLAQLYGTDKDNIKKNYSRNKQRFIEGKHYFLVKGDELHELKNSVTVSHLVDKRTPKLTLWTERGAARHAKMLETDQAWEVFEKLEDFYFAKSETTPKVDPVKSEPRKAVRPVRHQVPKYRYIISMTVEDLVTGQTETFRGGANTPDEIITGVACRFGMHIFDMVPVPINAF